MPVLTAAAAQVPGPAQVQRAQSPARRREEPAQAQVRVLAEFTFTELIQLSAIVSLNQVILSPTPGLAEAGGRRPRGAGARPGGGHPRGGGGAGAGPAGGEWGSPSYCTVF